MASCAEIRRTSRRVSDSLYNLQRKREYFTREVNSLSAWWKGEGSKVFKEEYQDINFLMNRIFNMFDDLEDRLRRLSLEVQRAEEERRRKAQEQERLIGKVGF